MTYIAKRRFPPGMHTLGKHPPSVTFKTKPIPSSKSTINLNKTVDKDISFEFIEMEEPKIQAVPCPITSANYTRNCKLSKRQYWSTKSIPLLSYIDKDARSFKGGIAKNAGRKARGMNLIKAFKYNLSFHTPRNKEWGHRMLDNYLMMNERVSTLPIEEVEEESTLVDYWEKKEEYNEKYKKLLLELENEEKAEIRCKTSKLIDRKEINEAIQKINEEYNMTRDLILKQKILEEEAILSQYEKIVFSSK